MSRIGYALFLSLFLTASAAFGQVTVTIPNVSGAVGQVVEVPVTLTGITNLSGQGFSGAVTAFEFEVSASNPNIKLLQDTNSTWSGTLVESWGTKSCNPTSSKCSGFDSVDKKLTQDGVLLKIPLQMTASVSNETVTLSGGWLNNGFVAITPNPPTFTISTSTAPQAANDSYTVAEGGTLTISAGSGVLANDTDADPLTATLGTTTTNGVLNFSSDGSFTYTHNGGETTTDTFTYTASDGTETSGVATVTITVTPVNDAPTADNKTASTNENTAVGITLSGSDPESDPLTFSLASGPSNGTVSISGSTATYTPTTGFSGTDTFTYTANDGTVSSAAATVTVTVVADNAAPVASNVSALTLEDTAITIVLSATDADNDPLTFAIATQPSNGTISLSGSSVEYTPAANFNGSDSFTFTANDGTVSSAAATVSITVNAVNDAPVADDKSATVQEDASVAVTLTGSDVDGDAITFALASQPTNGTATLSGSTVTYTPNANYTGQDTFTYTANDGTADSQPATVTITVSPVNDAPVASDVTASGDEDTPITVTLVGTDGDGDALTYVIATQPSNGTVALNGAEVTYTPAENYNGTDSFTYTATDGVLPSSPATATITVNPVNDVPTVVSQVVETTSDAALQVTLSGSDVDGDDLTYAIAAEPPFGSVTLSGNVVTYQANTGFVGTDAFAFTASDGSATSAMGTVTVQVLPPRTFTIQFVHGGGNGLPAAVDVYYGTTQVVAGLNSGSASTFLTLPLGESTVSVAASPSTSSTEAFASYPATWTQGSTTSVVFAGLAGNPASTRMIEYPSAEQGTSGSLVDLVIVHASAVSPALDVLTITNDVNHTPLQTLGLGLTFENVSAGFTLTPGVHLIRVQTAGSGKGAGTLAEFSVDLSDAGGEFVSLVLSQQPGSSDPAPALAGVRPNGVVSTPGTVTSVTTDGSLPSDFVLRGNYPNPFNPTTTISFDLPETAEVQVDVLDLLGRTMISVPIQSISAGANRSISIDAADLTSGIYMYRVLARGASSTWVRSGTMTLIK